MRQIEINFTMDDDHYQGLENAVERTFPLNNHKMSFGDVLLSVMKINWDQKLLPRIGDILNHQFTDLQKELLGILFGDCCLILRVSDSVFDVDEVENSLWISYVIINAKNGCKPHLKDNFEDNLMAFYEKVSQVYIS